VKIPTGYKRVDAVYDLEAVDEMVLSEFISELRDMTKGWQDSRATYKWPDTMLLDGVVEMTPAEMERESKKLESAKRAADLAKAKRKEIRRKQYEKMKKEFEGEGG
jgi:hypothetical protein